MCSVEMKKTLNQLLAGEWQASHDYIAVAAWFEEHDLSGFAAYFFAHSDEERDHAKKLYGYFVERGVKMEPRGVDAPKVEFSSVVDALEHVLRFEKSVSKAYLHASNQALDERDHATYHFLGWFVKEQVEEEASFQSLLLKARAVGDNMGLLYQLDAHVKHA